MIQSESSQGVAPLQFTTVDDYTTFRADYAFKDNDIIIQFFLPTEALEARTGATIEQGARQAFPEFAHASTHPSTRQAWLQSVKDSWAQHFLVRDAGLRKYWLEAFPATLERVAMQVFLAQPPRLQASYVEELSSWWFKAVGFVVLKKDDLAKSLLTKIDQTLDEEGTSALLSKVT